MVARRLFQILLLTFLGLSAVYPQTTADRNDMLRDVALTVPAVAKAGLGFAVVGLGIVSLPRPDNALDAATIIAGGVISAALAVGNTALIANAWTGNAEKTRFWRRFDFGVQAAWLATGLTFLIGDSVSRDAPVELLTTALPFAAAIGILMWVDTIPFSIEDR